MPPSLHDKLFGPLPQVYCEFFTVFSGYFFIKLIISLIILVIFAISPSHIVPGFMRKFIDGKFSMIAFGTALIMVVLFDGYGYFINRLLHSMCVNGASRTGIASSSGSCATCGAY